MNVLKESSHSSASEIQPHGQQLARMVKLLQQALCPASHQQLDHRSDQTHITRRRLLTFFGGITGLASLPYLLGCDGGDAEAVAQIATQLEETGNLDGMGPQIDRFLTMMESFNGQVANYPPHVDSIATGPSAREQVESIFNINRTNSVITNPQTLTVNYVDYQNYAAGNVGLFYQVLNNEFAGNIDNLVSSMRDKAIPILLGTASGGLTVALVKWGIAGLAVGSFSATALAAAIGAASITVLSFAAAANQ